MNWVKSGFFGFVSAVVIFVIIKISIVVSAAPFEALPVAVILERWGVNYPFLAFLFVVSGGIVGGLVLAWLFENNITAFKGGGVCFVVWLLAMFTWAPLAGWGVFGLQSEAGFWLPLYTLFIYLLYGSLVGKFIDKWVYFETGVAGEIKFHAEQDK